MCWAFLGLISLAVLVPVAPGFRAAIDRSDRGTEGFPDPSQPSELAHSAAPALISLPDDAVPRSLHGTSARLARWVGKSNEANTGVHVHTNSVASRSDFAGDEEPATFAPLFARGSRGAAEVLGLVTPAAAAGAGDTALLVAHSSYSGAPEPRGATPPATLLAAAASAPFHLSPLAVHVSASLSRGAASALGLATPPLATGATETRVIDTVPHRAFFPSPPKDSSSGVDAAAPVMATQRRAASPGDAKAASSEAASSVVVAPVSLAEASVQAHVAVADGASTSASASAGADVGAGSGLAGTVGAVGTWAEVVTPSFDVSQISFSTHGAEGWTLQRKVGIAFFVVVFLGCAWCCLQSSKPKEKRIGRGGDVRGGVSQLGGRSVRFEAGRPARPTTMSGKLADVEDVIRDIADGDQGSSGSEDKGGNTRTSLGASWDATVRSPRADNRDSTSSSRASTMKSPQDSTAQMVAEVKALAKDLEGPVQKYPKSGRSSLLDGFRRIQNRHVVIVPRPTKESRDRRTAESEIARWRGGCLGWWESKEEYKKNERPKGYVMLGKILDVNLSSKDKQAVTIEHRDQDMTCNLELVLPTQELARRFDSSLKDLLSKLNGRGGL